MRSDSKKLATGIYSNSASLFNCEWRTFWKGKKLIKSRPMKLLSWSRSESWIVFLLISTRCLLLKKPINDEFKQPIRECANYVCEYCHSPERLSADRFTIDHVIPKSLSCFVTNAVFVQTLMSKVQNVILVHGFWEDGSCYSEIIPTLLAEGYEVIAVQNPLTSLEDDIAATKRALDHIEGKCILVGHSWGGFVITTVGNDERVAGLVYIAALAPDAGESMIDLMSKYGSPSPHFQEQDGFVWISKEGFDEVLANDLSAERRALMCVTQITPSVSLTQVKASSPAWRDKPSWYILAANDRAVPPDLQRDMSQRMSAKVVAVESSHFSMISHPKEVLEVIREATASSQ